MEPVVAEGVVYIGAMDGYCRALDAQTGLERWNNRLSSMEDVYTSAPYWPPVSFGDVVIATKRPTDITPDNIIALSKADGSVRWSGTMNGWPSRLTPARDGKAFYTIYSEARKRGVQYVSAEDGAVIWQKEIPTAMYAGVLEGNALVVRDDMTASCVDAATGNLKWSYRTAVGPQGSLFGPPSFTVKGTTAYIGTMDGDVIALQW